MNRSVSRSFWSALLAVSATAAFASAQVPVPPPLVVNVRVVDTSNVPLAGAEVTIVQGLSAVRANGTTDARGSATLTITAPDGSYQLITRKIGFLRAAEFFPAHPGPLSFRIVMQRAVQSLAPVRVNAQQDLERKSYFIDADEIAKHADELIDASDILKKLRPDMICGRSCSPMQAVAARTRAPVRACPTLAFQPRRSCPVTTDPMPSLSTNVWVNGVWISTIATDTVCQVGRRGMLAGLSPGSMQVLCEIQPEHIEQITYADQFNTTVGKPHSDSAIFIVLKRGVAYKPGGKSYVVDEATGEPIAGAHVTDAKSGDYVNTSATGTASLVFLPEGSSLVKITKAGYEDLNVTVDIGPTGLTPLTLLMRKKPDGQ